MNTAKDKILIGITGVIASGKSMVLNHLRSLGYFCLSADEINNELLNQELHIKHINALLFNESSNVLDKEKIKELIFNNQEKKKQLEHYLHPLIEATLLTKAQQATQRIIFIEVPLLFESNASIYHKVITIYLDRKNTIKRLMKRDHITKNEAIKRIDSQLPIEEKVSRSDYVIDNSKTVSHTLKQVQHVLKELEKEYGNL